MRSFERSHITKQCACSTPGTIIFPLFLRLRVDRRKRFKYDTCGREFFQKRREKPPFSKISGYAWTRHKSHLWIVPGDLKKSYLRFSHVNSFYSCNYNALKTMFPFILSIYHLYWCWEFKIYLKIIKVFTTTGKIRV